MYVRTTDMPSVAVGGKSVTRTSVRYHSRRQTVTITHELMDLDVSGKPSCCFPLPWLLPWLPPSLRNRARFNDPGAGMLPPPAAPLSWLSGEADGMSWSSDARASTAARFFCCAALPPPPRPSSGLLSGGVPKSPSSNPDKSWLSCCLNPPRADQAERPGAAGEGPSFICRSSPAKPFRTNSPSLLSRIDCESSCIPRGGGPRGRGGSESCDGKSAPSPSDR
mmetsp:Transcript_14178/g.40760  ORF Transcript_14178/g.40760 Transcript_14178/m.40760 type:complete len:222 (-) Transcript_14178:1843-2508(-)